LHVQPPVKLAMYAVLVVLLGTTGTAAAARCERPAIREDHPGRRELASGAVREAALVDGALVWISGDTTWRMSQDGCLEALRDGEEVPQLVSRRLVVDGTAVLTMTKEALVEPGPSGPLRRIPIVGLPDQPETFAVHDGAVYLNVFRGDAIYKVTIATGQVETFAKLPADSGHFGLSLAASDAALYVTSYGKRWLAEVPFATRAPKILTRALPSGPVGVAVANGQVFVNCEDGPRFAGALLRIDLATAKSQVIATKLVNSDQLLVDDGFVYLRSYVKTKERRTANVNLLRVPVDGRGKLELVEGNLPRATQPLVASADAVFAAGNGAMIRIAKR